MVKHLQLIAATNIAIIEQIGEFPICGHVADVIKVANIRILNF